MRDALVGDGEKAIRRARDFLRALNLAVADLPVEARNGAEEGDEKANYTEKAEPGVDVAVLRHRDGTRPRRGFLELVGIRRFCGLPVILFGVAHK